MDFNVREGNAFQKARDFLAGKVGATIRILKDEEKAFPGDAASHRDLAPVVKFEFDRRTGKVAEPPFIPDGRSLFVPGHPEAFHQGTRTVDFFLRQFASNDDRIRKPSRHAFLN